jgi:type VI protein secretion system component Hcp
MANRSIFLSFEGVPGELELPAATVPPGPAKDWIELLSCRFSAEVSTQARAMTKGASSRVDFGGAAPPVEVVKRTDAATLGLMREFFGGKTPRRATVVFVRTADGGPAEYLRYDLQNCWIVGFDVLGDGSDRALETIQLRYEKMDLITFAGGHGAKQARASATLLNGA